MLTPLHSMNTALQNPFVSEQRTGRTADEDEEDEIGDEDHTRIQTAGSPDLGGTLVETTPVEVNGREMPHRDPVTGSTMVVEDARATPSMPMNGAQELPGNKEPGRSVERAERRSEFSLPSSPQDLSTPHLDHPGSSHFRSINTREGHSAGEVVFKPGKRKPPHRMPRRTQDGRCDHDEGNRGLWQEEDETGGLRWLCYHCPGCRREDFFTDKSFVSHVLHCAKVDKQLLPKAKGVLTWPLARENFMHRVEPKSGIVKWRLS